MNYLTFRQRLIITYSVATLALIFLTFVGVSFYIDSLQKKNVQDAFKLAEEQARSMAMSINDILTAEESGDYNDPAVKASLRALARINIMHNESILWAAVITPDGERIVDEIGEGGRQMRLQRDPTEPYNTDLNVPGIDDLTVEVVAMPEKTSDISVPIKMEGNKDGRILLRVMDSPTFQRIESSSQRITSTLLFGCLLMLLFLLGVFSLLWKMFFKQLALERTTARLDRMAYVGTLASGLAHEIRNPLSSMNVNLEVIREDLHEGEAESLQRADELSLRVQNEVQNLNSTLTSFLDFALPRKQGYSHFELRALVEELVEAHQEEVRRLEINVEVVSPASEDTVIEADRHLLHQALRNIIVNAIDVVSNSLKKTIQISIQHRPKDRIRVAVADTGPGISEEVLPRIFEVFFSTRKGGSGFGLAIARKIMEEHQGAIWAENNHEALGATFFLELPVLAPPDDRATEGRPALWMNKRIVMQESER